jgi:hypothetical protein
MDEADNLDNFGDELNMNGKKNNLEIDIDENADMQQ